MTKPLLSAVIPIHKMSGKLEPLKKWTREAMNQSIQLILIHDFGDQETESELIDLVNSVNSDQIKLISGKFGSPGAARNQGLAEIKTEYFCFWDCDDEPDVRAFAKMAGEARRLNAEIAVGKFTRTSDGKIPGVFRNRSSLNLVDRVAFNPGIWRMVFQTSQIGIYRFENLKWAEDQLFLSDIKFADRNVFEFQDSVYLYNNENSSSLTNNPQNASYLLPSIEKLLQTINSNDSRKLRAFNAILVLRQTMTLLKRGDLILKWKGLNQLFMLLNVLKLAETIDLFRKFVSSRKIK